ncbi:hypothetical protein [Photobacterium phosphoreum]|uniref:hypothetical protein n=1 Tax=Photobacterium phosphoreum TaxID=659 RepID=UPI001E344E44|nr:hypothetical protein [Photobacterium phosphoreum]MCD9477097.1 hypothetical protein [Photobacterium phosphoreum]MCF2177868.1 hypothetical protein [Photobacterium phosphoreum]
MNKEVERIQSKIDLKRRVIKRLKVDVFFCYCRIFVIIALATISPLLSQHLIVIENFVLVLFSIVIPLGCGAFAMGYTINTWRKIQGYMEKIESIENETFELAITYFNSNVDLNTLAFNVIRIRSLIAEALLFDIEKTQQHVDIIKVACRTNDVIEHIAQDAINEEVTAITLIQSLETALYLLNEYQQPLNNSRLNIPTVDEIQVLIEMIKQKNRVF